MKKALLASLCFILVSLTLVDGTFAADFGKAVTDVFADLKDIFGEVLGTPEAGGEGKTVDVALVSNDKQQNLFPGGAVSRAFHVKNHGTGSVYFRLVYAIQYDEESWPKLDIDFDADDTVYDQTEWSLIEIGTTPYKMKVFTYTKELSAETISPDVRISIAMDTSVTSEQLSRYGSDFLQIQALAIETDSFTKKNITDAVDALDEALPLDTLNPF